MHITPIPTPGGTAAATPSPAPPPEAVESGVARTVLQQGEMIRVGDREYEAAPPSIGTLIMASEAVARLPKLQLDEGHMVEDALRSARHCRAIGEIAAILILGSRRAKERVRVRRVWRRRLFGVIPVERTETRIARRYELLADRLLDHFSPRELYSTIARLIGRQQIGDFFGLTTFLNDLNLTRPTKVVTGATPSGQP